MSTVEFLGGPQDGKVMTVNGIPPEVYELPVYSKKLLEMLVDGNIPLDYEVMRYNLYRSSQSRYIYTHESIDCARL